MDEKQDDQNVTSKEEVRRKEQLDCIAKLTEMIQNDRVGVLLIAVKGSEANSGDICIFADDINQADYHMLVGFLQTDVTLRQMSLEILSEREDDDQGRTSTPGKKKKKRSDLRLCPPLVVAPEGEGNHGET